MTKKAFFLMVILLVAGLTMIGCPEDSGEDTPTDEPTPIPTQDPDTTPAPTAEPNPAAPAVIFGNGAFDASLTNTYIMNTDDSVSIDIADDVITIPAIKNVDIRFDPVDASAYTKMVITANTTLGGTVAFYSYDPTDDGGIKHLTGYGNVFLSIPFEILFADLSAEGGWDPNGVGFQSASFDGFLVYTTAETEISKVELQ